LKLVLLKKKKNPGRTRSKYINFFKGIKKASGLVFAQKAIFTVEVIFQRTSIYMPVFI